MAKELNWEVLDGILQFNATKRQCADILNISEDSIERKIKKKHKKTFSEYRDGKMSKTVIKLQQKAIESALQGSYTMNIFCLKNLAGWKDSPGVGEGAETTTINLNYNLES